MSTIKLRRGTAAEWASANPVLAEGEPGFETDTGRYRVGDGTTEYSGLPFFLTDTELKATYVSGGVEDASGVRQSGSVRVVLDAFGEIDDLIYEEA